MEEQVPAKKKIKQVKVSPGCISCGTCEVICPKVFKINAISCVKEDVDLNQEIECIKEAVEMCPVQTIEIEWE